MALDRQSIVKKDFPVGQHGYEPAAVDAHLAQVAEELEEFKQSARRRAEGLASSASDQVRAIVAAAESTAAEIVRSAEEEAREIREEADRDAHAIRQRATDEARESFGKVSDSTQSMVQRLDAMESELSALIESLRTGSDRLNADLQALEGHVHEVGDSLQRPPRFEPEGHVVSAAGPEAAPAEAHEPAAGESEEPPMYEPPPAASEEPPAHEPPAGEQPAWAAPPPPEASEPTGASDAAGGEGAGWGQASEGAVPAHSAGETGGTDAWGREEAPAAPLGGDPGEHPGQGEGGSPGTSSEDMEGARLIALNMALNGTPREETDRYLDENFHLPDRQSLLDEVYSSVED